MPKIAAEEVARIREEADIVEIIGDYIPLTQKGKNFFGICPFHQDHSPSMSVSREKQMFKCFSCGAAGNVFKFVSDYENISYVEAIEKVAAKVGISIKISDTYKPKEKFSKEYEIMALATNFYQNNLNTEAGLPAKKYLIDRGLTDEMIKEFNIGLSFSNNQLRDFLTKKNISNEELLKVGLVNQKDLEYHDVFSDRILFPIHDEKGNVVAFTGRVYEKDRTPKYLNSKETIIFKKGNILFNLHRAKNAIRLEKRLIIVEGNMDAIRMYASGFKNTVALMGTSLTKEQIALISKQHVKVLLMFDNDEAGSLATMTNGRLLENAGIQVEVVRLSGQKDPDEYILKNGKEKMSDVLKHPMSFIEFQYENLKENKNLNDTENLREYVKNDLDSLKGADAITIDITLHKLAEEYNLTYEVLKSELQTEEKPLEISLPPSKEKRKSRYEKSAEHILYYMMNSQRYIKIYQAKLGYFKDEGYRKIANEILYYAEENNKIELADFLTYAELSPLKNEIYAVIKSIKDVELDDTSFMDYIRNIKEIMWEEEVKKIKAEQKQVQDINEKEKLGQKIVDLMIKIQEIKKERSVKE